ncbi:hypothetical protein ANRL3_01349 [Anaerolineae bacterium]|nr:hypothetical protein ANRL3_01349 [Anaerolineae bacterium]
MQKIFGNAFHAVDFHVHTPGSPDFKDKSATPNDIVSAAIRVGLEAIAITDHNTPLWIKLIQDAARNSGLVVFPGVEITTRGGHVIALFDSNESQDVVGEVLIESGIGNKNWGHEDALGIDIQKVFEVIAGKGGIAIAAHADGPKGFLTTLQQGQARIGAYKDPNLLALEIIEIDQKQKYVEGKDHDYGRSIACIQGSDAHSIDDIGKHRTLLRMHHISLEGVRQAFGEPQLRVRFVDEMTLPPYPHVASLKVSQGFLSAQVFRFNPNLNCIVGGAGSGKSTIIEFLRFALDQISNMKDMADDCWGKLGDLAGIGASVEVEIALESNEVLSVTRVFNNSDNPIIVRRLSDGRKLENIDVRKIFPVHAYSQGEAISISRSPLAQLELIDKHLVSLPNFQHEIAQAYRQMSDQAIGLVRLEGVIRGREIAERNIATINAEIDSSTRELNDLQRLKKNPVVASHQLWIAEKSYLTELIASFDKTRNDINEKINDITLFSRTVAHPQESTPNSVLISECSQLAKQTEDIIENVRKNLFADLKKTEDQIRSKARAWKELWEKHNNEYEGYRVKEGETRTARIMSDLERLRNDHQKAKTQFAQIEEAEKTYQRQVNRREELIATVHDQKARIYALRDRKAKEMMKRIGDAISLKVSHEGNRSAYDRALQELMKGSYATPVVIKKITSSILPFQLVRLIKEENIVEIDKIAQIGEKWAKELVQQGKSRPELLYQLETTPVEDLLEISFKVERGVYRELEKLSTGQKATVIVLLTMVEGKQPIIFDQPEDALYTPFIYSEVVKLLKSKKDQRQFVLATHNANISIAADLDLGIILEGTSDKANIRSAGGLDDEDTQKLMVLHLEGGEEAFLTRHKKYGLQRG